MTILTSLSSISCLFWLHKIANFSSNICSCVKMKNWEINICVIWESFQKIWLFVNHWMHLNTRKKIENWHSDALRNFRLACEIVKCLFCYNSRRCSPRLRIKRSLGGGFDLKLVTERCVSSWYHDRTCISQKLKCIENVKWFNARNILQNKVIFHNMSSSKKSFQSSENEKWYIFCE